VPNAEYSLTQAKDLSQSRGKRSKGGSKNKLGSRVGGEKNEKKGEGLKSCGEGDLTGGGGREGWELKRLAGGVVRGCRGIISSGGPWCIVGVDRPIQKKKTKGRGEKRRDDRKIP